MGVGRSVQKGAWPGVRFLLASDYDALQCHQPRRGALWQSRIGQQRLPALPNGSGTERTKGGVARGSVPADKSTNGTLREYVGGVRTPRALTGRSGNTSEE
ncbi:UNVERIFIED_CONTAM: hypothetical protein FKN15_040324 [Acipenser sinensis]